jgi:hypothetical protein
VVFALPVKIEETPMAMSNERVYSPRLSVELNEDQFNALQRLIPHGLKRQIFEVIVNDLITLLETSHKREAIFAAIIGRMVNIPERSIGVGNEPSST